MRSSLFTARLCSYVFNTWSPNLANAVIRNELPWSHIIHKNLWLSGGMYYSTLVVCHFLCLALYISWQQLQAVHRSMPFCMSVSSYLQSRSIYLTLWSCGLPVHCKPRGWLCIFHDIWIIAALEWFSVAIRYNHFHLLFFFHKIIMVTFIKIHWIDKHFWCVVFVSAC